MNNKKMESTSNDKWICELYFHLFFIYNLAAKAAVITFKTSWLWKKKSYSWGFRPLPVIWKNVFLSCNCTESNKISKSKWKIPKSSFPASVRWNRMKLKWLKSSTLNYRLTGFFFSLSSSGRIISCKWCSLLTNRRWLISQTEQPNQSASQASYIRAEGPRGACILHHRSNTVVRARTPNALVFRLCGTFHEHLTAGARVDPVSTQLKRVFTLLSREFHQSC